MDEFPFLVAFTNVMRGLSVVAGILVVLDCIKIWAKIEYPAHHPKGNALAWGVIGFGSSIGAVAVVYYSHPLVTVNTFERALSVCFIWSAIALALVIRAGIRSVRPGYIWASSLMFILAGFFVTWGFF